LFLKELKLVLIGGKIMSDLYKKTFRGYLIDHHSPDPPTVTLENINVDEFEKFLLEANVNNLMVYFKDHWGNSYYDTKIGKKHAGLKEDWIAKLAPLLKELNIEFNAYYCFEYDTFAPAANPEWAVKKQDGTPLRCGENSYAAIAKWGIPCYETGYRAYILDQLKEIISNYKPDSLFIDIFGKSLCYCETCKSKFKNKYGYDIPSDDKGILGKKKDLIEYLNDSSERMLEDVKKQLKEIDPTLAITVNFAAHYPKEIRNKLDYVFTEPWAGNWLSAIYARDTSRGKYPQLGPGDVSSVFNYLPETVYELAAAQITAGGCRAFIYSESMRPDGSLEFEEAKRVGTAYREVEKYEALLEDREVISDIGIIQSDIEDEVKMSKPLIANAIGRAKVGGPHRDAILGAMKICDYLKYPWDIIPEEEATIERITSHKAIILPNMYYLSDKLKDTLSEFVKKGGILLCSDETSLYDRSGNKLSDFSIKDMLGLSFTGKDEKYSNNNWSAYINTDKSSLWKYTAHTCHPVKDYKILVEPLTADKRGWFIDPACELTPTTWVNWGYPPPSKQTEHPAVLINQFGKGKVVYSAFDIFTMENHEYNWIKGLFKGILEECMEPTIYLNTETPSILSFAAYKKDNRLIIHEISNMAKLTKGDAPNICGGELIVSKGAGAVKEAHMYYPSKKSLPVEEEQNFYRIKLENIRIHNIIILTFNED
jgi:hypothetical protein